MLSEKIKQMRSEMAAHWSILMFDEDHNGREAESFSQGFDAAWALHKRLVAPLLFQLDQLETEMNCKFEEIKNYKSEVGE